MNDHDHQPRYYAPMDKDSVLKRLRGVYRDQREVARLGEESLRAMRVLIEDIERISAPPEPEPPVAPEPEPEPDPPPVRPPRPSRPNLEHLESDGMFHLELDPATRRSFVTMDVDKVRAWAKRRARTLGPPIEKHPLGKLLFDWAWQDEQAWLNAPGGLHVSGHGEPAWGGGSYGVAPYWGDWYLTEDGIFLWVSELCGWINRAHIVADWDAVARAENRGYTLHRQNSWLPGTPALEGEAAADYNNNTPNGDHLSRLWKAAWLLVRHCRLPLALWWINQVWRDAAYSLNVGVTDWHQHGAPHPALSPAAPLEAKIDYWRANGYTGELGRGYMHVGRFAAAMVEIGYERGGPFVEGAPVQPHEAVTWMRKAIAAAVACSGFAVGDPRSLVLQYNHGMSGRAGYVVDRLTERERAAGRWALAGEAMYWVDTLRALGKDGSAGELANWVGPHPRWALLLDARILDDMRYGAAVDTNHPQVAGLYNPRDRGTPSEHWERVPDYWMFTHPHLATAESVMAVKNNVGSRREHPWDSLPPERRKELLWW